MTRERKRLDYLRQIYLPRLEARPSIKNVWRINTDAAFAESIFHELRETDPSEKKIYLERLLNWTLTGQLTPDGLEDMKHTLFAFEQIKQQLPNEKRDINNYKLSSAFFDAVYADCMQRLALLIEKNPTEWSELHEFPVNGDDIDKRKFALRTIIASDPTGGTHRNSIINWMEYAAEPLLPEDLPRIHDYLVLHHKNHSKIPADRRHIKYYQSWIELQAVVLPYMPADRFTDEFLGSLEDHEIAMGRAELLAKGEDWTLIRIKTEEAAIIMGQGTEWCTAFTNGRKNHFKRYSDDLLYLRINGGERLQLHFPGMEIRDVLDRRTSRLVDLMTQRDDLAEAIARFDNAEENISQMMFVATKLDTKAPVVMEQLLILCSKWPRWAQIAGTEIPYIYKEARHDEVKLIMEDACFNNKHLGWSIQTQKPFNDHKAHMSRIRDAIWGTITATPINRLFN